MLICLKEVNSFGTDPNEVIYPMAYKDQKGNQQWYHQDMQNGFVNVYPYYLTDLNDVNNYVKQSIAHKYEVVIISKIADIVDVEVNSRYKGER